MTRPWFKVLYSIPSHHMQSNLIRISKSQKILIIYGYNHYSTNINHSSDITSKAIANRQELKTNRQIGTIEKESRRNIGEILGIVLATIGTIGAIIYYMNENAKHKEEQMKYSKERKYQIIKNSMLQLIPIDPLELPELKVKEQIDMVKKIIFSKNPSLVLIEGAQGSGKTTLVQNLLNERIKDKVPCYYWSLKKCINRTDFGNMFLELFGIRYAMDIGEIAEGSVNGQLLIDVFRDLKREHGAPCVLVIDDVQKLFTDEQGENVALFLQECYREGYMTTIFIGSEGSILEKFRSLSGYASRLKYYSLPPIPDHIIKNYLNGPINDHLKAIGNQQLLDKELIDWYVAHFGGNFLDLKDYIEEVLVTKRMDHKSFVSQSIGPYNRTFKLLCNDSNVQTILDELLKKSSFDISHPYDENAITILLQNNIISQHANTFTWNKRLVQMAYQDFIQRRYKPWYRWFL